MEILILLLIGFIGVYISLAVALEMYCSECRNYFDD